MTAGSSTNKLLPALLVVILASTAGCQTSPPPPTQYPGLAAAEQELFQQQQERVAECNRVHGHWRQVQVFQGGAKTVNLGERQSWQVNLSGGEYRLRARVRGEWVHWFLVVDGGRDGVLAFGPSGGQDCRMFTRPQGSYSAVVHNFGRGEWRGVLEERG